MKRIFCFSLGLALAACGNSTEPVTQAAGSDLGAPSAPFAATDLGTLGGVASYAQDINNRSIVVGWSETASGQVHAFRWTAREGMTDLGTLPGGSQSAAVRILNSGVILGWSQTAGGQQVPVQWSSTGLIQDLGIPLPPGATFMSPSDFNLRGEVVGNAYGDFEHGWYWSASTGTIDLRERIPSCLENGANAINAAGVVAGTFCDPSALWLHPFTWHVRGSYRDLGVGNDVTNANGAGLAINNPGMVAGWLDLHGNVSPSGTLWSRGRGHMLLPNLPGSFPNGYATALNSQGVAVGASWDEAFGGYQPVAWPTPTTLVRLNGDVPLFAIATAINQAGDVVGWGASGGAPNRALLWKLSRGKAATALSPGGAAPAIRGAASPAAALRGAQSCLAEPRAMASKASLSDCVLRRR